MNDLIANLLPWSFHASFLACFALGAWSRIGKFRALGVSFLLAYAFGFHMSARYLTHNRPMRIWEDLIAGRDTYLFGIFVWGFGMALFPLVLLLLALGLGFLIRTGLAQYRKNKVSSNSNSETPVPKPPTENDALPPCV